MQQGTRGGYYLRHGNGGCPSCDSIETAHKETDGWHHWLCLQCEARWAVGPHLGWHFPDCDGEEYFTEYITEPARAEMREYRT